MSEKRTICPACLSPFVGVLKIHDPDTTNMNCDVTFKCNDCGHTWEGKEISEYMKDLRRKGRRI